MKTLDEKIAVSIVLPVYNVARFLKKCISCLQSQTLKNIEMIFVDDCGSDDSVEIIEKYAGNDNRIRLVRNDANMGAGATRNRGILEAKGEYIAFVDPDDWMNPEFYERLYTTAKDGDYDVVIGERLDVIRRSTGEWRYAKPSLGQSVLRACACGLPLYAGFIHGHQAAIYRLSMVRENNAHYADASFGECGLFLLTACMHANSFCCTDGAYYYYLQHDDSNAHSLNREKYDSELRTVFEQIDYAIANDSGLAGCKSYVARKFAFLLWRVNELVHSEPMHGYLRQYLESIRVKMVSLPEEYELISYNMSFQNIMKGRFRLYIFTVKYAWLFRVVRRVRGGVARRLKRAFGRLGTVAKYDFDKRQICYIQSARGALYFCKEFLDKGGEFARSYIQFFSSSTKGYNNDLPIGSETYEEHRLRIAKGELCWKYVRRLGHISKSTIYMNDKDELCMRGEILGNPGPVVTRNLILLPQPERKIMMGITLKNYIDSKGNDVDDVAAELIQFLEYVFHKYEICQGGPIAGIAFDARPCNCMLGSGHEYLLFDFEYEYRTNLERDFFVYLATLDVRSSIRQQVYFALCDHFHVAPNTEKWGKRIIQGWVEIIAPTIPCKYLLEDEQGCVL